MAILAPYGFTEIHSDDWVIHNHFKLLVPYDSLKFCIMDILSGFAVDYGSAVGPLSHSCHSGPPPAMADSQPLSGTDQ